MYKAKNHINKKINLNKTTRVLYYGISLFALASTFFCASANANEYEEHDFVSNLTEIPVEELKNIQLAQATITIPKKQDSSPINNSTSKEFEIVVPFNERGSFLGDLPVVIIEDEPHFEADRVAQLLSNIAAPSTLEKIKSLGINRRIKIEDLVGIGIKANWDSGNLLIDVTISPEDKIRRDIEIAELERKETGQYHKPAKFGIYSNIRTSFDYEHKGFETGIQDPKLDLTLGGRILGVAFDNEFTYDTSGFGLKRIGTRFTFDNEQLAVRTILGDVRPQARGYQSGYEIVGLSISSEFQAIQPYRNLSPRGEGSFTLKDTSNVDVIINGRIVRRMKLDSGSYNLKDFPFLDGQNRVQFLVEDGTGRRELAKFDIFFDRSQLATGLSEWAFSIGSTTTTGLRQPIYDKGKFYANGFFRKGVNSSLTMGGNLQLFGDSGLVGWEAIKASKIGIISWDLANSWSKFGEGNAINLSFNRNLGSNEKNQISSLGFAISARSKFFGSNDLGQTNNSEAYNINAFWTRTLGIDGNLAFDTNYSKGRNGFDDNWSARFSYGKRISSRLGLNTEISYGNNRFGNDFSFRIQLTSRFGKNGTMSTAFDSQNTRLTINAQKSGQSNYGSWSVNGDIDKSEQSGGINAGAFLAASRGDIGLSHSTTFDADFANVTNERTSLRLSTAFGFADGAFAWGKPIYGGFAITRPHKSLKGANIIVDSNSDSNSFINKIFGPSMIGNIPNYVKREIPIDVDNLPLGYDLGTGSISIRAPYNAGYKLIVGSDDNLTIIGRALIDDETPISFISAKAIRKQDGKIVETFTNSKGVFSATGMGPGDWEIEFATKPDPVFINITLDAKGDSMRKLGDLKGQIK